MILILKRERQIRILLILISQSLRQVTLTTQNPWPSLNEPAEKSPFVTDAEKELFEIKLKNESISFVSVNEVTVEARQAYSNGLAGRWLYRLPHQDISGALEEFLMPPLRPRPPNIERVFARLQHYDTHFLVDDSASMFGSRWTTAKEVMAQIASIAVKYSRNGIDVRFCNASLEGRVNLDSADKVMRLFEILDPDGPTFFADVIEAELNEYIHKYKNDRYIKGLNLIVLTDGDPSLGQDVESMIVKYARILAQEDAPPLQVGIQFVQIGDEERAKNFFYSLDDNLQKKYNLDRHVSWFIFFSEGNANDNNRWWTLYPGLMETRIDCTKRFCWEEY